MNKENAKGYLPLVQALADGKELEFLNRWGQWEPAGAPEFGYEPERYRIKPAARWFVEFCNTSHAYDTEEKAREVARHPSVQAASGGNVRVYKAREVCS